MGGIYALFLEQPFNGIIFRQSKSSPLAGKFVQHLQQYISGVGLCQVVHHIFAFEHITVTSMHVMLFEGVEYTALPFFVTS